MSRRRQPQWFKDFIVRYKRSVASALLLGLIASGCAALLMFTSGYLISATAMPGITLFSVMIPVACVQLFGFGRPLARYLERLVSHDWVFKVTSDLRRMLYWGIERRSGDPAGQKAAGEYLGLLSDDIAHLQNLYLRVVFPTAIAFLLAIGASIFFAWFSIPFALVMLLVFALDVVLLPWATLLATRSQTEYAKSLKATVYEHLTDDVLGATDWVLSGRGDDAVTKHAGQARVLQTVESSIRMRQRAFSLAGTLLLGAAICLIVLWSGHSFGAEPLAANLIAAFVLGFFPLIEAFSMLPAALSQAPTHDDAIARLDDVSHFEGGQADRASSTTSSSPLPGNTAISLRDVSYAYPGSAGPVLEGISLDIARASSVAILGKSGSGKSTLANIMRHTLSPKRGSVLVEGAIGYLGQSPHLFNRTLRDNLTLGVVDVDDSELGRILADVGLHDRIASLPQGLDTVIGETGTGFSGGEEHRIALARVLAADTPIVLVDEPFAALDPETEASLLEALFETCENRTLVVITHHLAQIERFDRVIFIEEGRVALDGAPDELLEQSGHFHRLVEFDRADAFTR